MAYYSKRRAAAAILRIAPRTRRPTAPIKPINLSGKNVSSILLIGVKQAPLDESNVINRDARSVSHDDPMFQLVQSSYITGDCRITASGFLIVRKEIGDGDIRLFFYMALDNGKSGVNHINL